jgi:hypothetical protein
MTALRRRLSATTKPAKRKSRKVVAKSATTKVGKAKALGKKSTSKATGKGPSQAKGGRQYRSTSFAGDQRTLSRVVKPRSIEPARRLREESERVTPLFAHVLRALGTEAEAREFMATPHPELGGLSPLQAAKTDPGARRVEEILHALEYGLAL